MSKRQVIGLILLVVLFLGFSFFFYFEDRKEKSYYLYLFTGDDIMVKWYYNHNTWYFANTDEKLKDSFDVYSDGKYQGEYNLLYNDGWHYYDLNNKSVELDGNKFMLNTNYEVKSYSFNFSSVTDEKLKQQIMNQIGIDNKYNGVIKKFVIKGNENFKDIYFADFYLNQNEYNPLGPSYTVAFTQKNDKMELIRVFSFDSEDSESCNLVLKGLFTFENNNDKLLLSCAHFDLIPDDYYLYEYNGKNYNLLIEGNGGV